MSKYLVTGGAGFIGSNIAETLVKRGETVRILDNCSTGNLSNLEKIINQVEFIQGDIRDLSTIHKAVKDIDYILHQAALPSVARSVDDPIIANEINITGTLNLLISARDEKVKRLVYASSSSVYGNSPILPKQEDMTVDPISPYAVTKYTGEQYCKVFFNLYGLETVILRYFNVFGPRQNPDSVYAAVIPIFIHSFLEKKSPFVFGDGEQSRDFTFIEDVVDANIMACYADAIAGETFNIACGRCISLNELISNIKELLNSDINVTYTQERKGDVRHSLADITKAKSLLKYEPKVDLREGLLRTIEYMKK